MIRKPSQIKELLAKKVVILEEDSKKRNADVLLDAKVPCGPKEFNDEEVLLEMKKGGFKRQSPQESPVDKSKVKDFSCKNCDSTLQSKELLDAHMVSNHKVGPSNQCNYCETVFWTELQLKSHVELHHVEESVKITK